MATISVRMDKELFDAAAVEGKAEFRKAYNTNLRSKF